MSALQDEIMKQIQQQQQMENYRKSQQSLNSQPTGLVGKVSNLGNSLNNFGSKLSQSQFQPIANLGVKAQGLGNTIGNFANASKGLGAASNALSNAAPAVGAATGALEVGGNLANGDYANAGLNALKTGATLAGGPIGMGVSAAIQAAQMLKGAKDKANAEAMKKVNEEANKSMTANAQETSQAQQNFINDAQQAAQNMTQPISNQALSQDIMSQINPNYTSSASGSPTGFASGINTPDTTQTLQNDQSVVPQIEDANGNVSAFPTTREAFAKSLTDNGWAENIVNSALQGLNGGNKDMADYISAYNENASDDQKIAIPKTEEEIELARNGQFYQPQGGVQDNNTRLKESLLDRIKNGLSNFKAGYEDNSQNGFADGDLANKLANNSQQSTTPQNGVLTGGAAQTKKTLMNRIGEAAGTGRRLMANPWVQAGIAGLISKADGGDIGDMAKAAYQYGTAKAMSDQYYKQMHPDAKVMPVFNTYGADDYKAKAYNDFNQGRTMVSRRDLIKLKNPDMSDTEIDNLIKSTGIDPEEMVSINAYKAVEKSNYDKGRLEQGEKKINNDYEIKKGQLGVAQSRASETARHNKVSENQRGQSIANAKKASEANNRKNNKEIKEKQANALYSAMYNAEQDYKSGKLSKENWDAMNRGYVARTGKKYK